MLEEALEHLVKGIVEHPDDVARPRPASCGAGGVARGPRPPRGHGQGHRPRRPHGQGAAHRARRAAPAGRPVRVDFLDVRRALTSAVLVVVGRLGRAHGIRGERDRRGPHRRARAAARRRLGAARPTRPRPARSPSPPPACTAAGCCCGSRAWRPDRCRGAARHAAAGRTSTPRGCRRTRTSATTTSSSACQSSHADGTAVGEVAEVVHLPGQDLLAVAPTGRRGGAGAVRRRLRPQVDLAGGRVVIDPPPGLLDLDRDERGVSRARRRRHDLPGLPRAAAALAGRPGAPARAARPAGARPARATPTTGTAPSTTPRTAAAPAW